MEVPIDGANESNMANAAAAVNAMTKISSTFNGFLGAINATRPTAKPHDYINANSAYRFYRFKNMLLTIKVAK